MPLSWVAGRVQSPVASPGSTASTRAPRDLHLLRNPTEHPKFQACRRHPPLLNASMPGPVSGETTKTGPSQDLIPAAWSLGQTWPGAQPHPASMAGLDTLSCTRSFCPPWSRCPGLPQVQGSCECQGEVSGGCPGGRHRRGREMRRGAGQSGVHPGPPNATHCSQDSLLLTLLGPQGQQCPWLAPGSGSGTQPSP